MEGVSKIACGNEGKKRSDDQWTGQQRVWMWMQMWPRRRRKHGLVVGMADGLKDVGLGRKAAFPSTS